MEMWVDERRVVHTGEPGHWTKVLKLSPSSFAAFANRLPPRVTLGLAGPPAATLDVLGAQLVRQSARWRLDYVWAIRECLAELVAGAEVDPCSV
jgi:hypothetical protein